MITQSESGLTQTQYENVQAATDDLSIQVQLQRYGPVWSTHEDSGAYYQRVMALNPLAYWPLWESSGSTVEDISGNGYDGTYSGVTPGQAGIGDGHAAVLLNGTSGYISVFGAELRDAFDGAEGSMLAWAKVRDSSVWADGQRREVFRFTASDWSDYFWYEKYTVTNAWWTRRMVNGAAQENYPVGNGTTDWICVALTWSESADEVITYAGGSRLGDIKTGLGTWDGTLGYAYIGAAYNNNTQVWDGWIAHAALFDKVLTPGQIASLSTL